MTSPNTATDAFSVTATTDKASYKTGDKITVTISGAAVRTEATTATATINLVAADGGTGTVTVAIPLTKTTPESVTIASVRDDQGHTWTVAAGGLSASTTA